MSEIGVDLNRTQAGEIIRRARAHAIREASQAFRGQHITTAPEVTAWLDAYADRVENGQEDDA